MPVNEHLMESLVNTYGEERAKSIYYAMEASGAGPFGNGNKLFGDHLTFASKHGLSPIMSKVAKRAKHAASAVVQHKRPRPMHGQRGTGAPKR